jgi:hypothetical protein
MGTDGTGSIAGRVFTVPVTTAESWNRFQKRTGGLYHHGDTLSIGAATRQRHSRRRHGRAYRRGALVLSRTTNVIG